MSESLDQIPDSPFATAPVESF
ncbi:MAG: hypothetical protein RL223_4240, partial [Pseudomonadota bacterium]